MSEQSTSTKPLSKTACLKAERAARREAKEAARADSERRLAAARGRVATLSKAMPASYAEWGVVRTRAYVQLLEIIQSKAGNVTMTADRLEGYLSELDRASTWSLPYCQHLSMLHARAADLSAGFEPEAA